MSHQPRHLTTATLINLNALWFGLGYLWNGLHTILLPLMLVGLVPDGLKATYLGALTFSGLLLAMILQPIVGAASDRSGWLGQFGKRRPWVALGTAIDLLFLLLLIMTREFRLLALAYIGLQVGSSIAEAALQGLLPDLAPSDQRGRASGYKNAAQIAGFVAGVGLGGLLAGQGHIGWALALSGLALAGTAAWTWLGVREQPVPRLRWRAWAMGPALRTLFVDSFRFDRQAVPGYGRLLAGRALLLAGYFALQGFAQYFVADELKVANPAGITALLMAVMGAAIFLLAVPTGALADRMGRRPLNVIAGAVGAVATLALVFVSDVAQLVVAGGLIGASVGVFLSVNWAWAADLVPAAEAGRYLGLSNLATAGASAVARLVSGPLIDGGNALRSGLGYTALFLLLALAMTVGTWLLSGVPETGRAAEERSRGW